MNYEFIVSDSQVNAFTINNAGIFYFLTRLIEGEFTTNKNIIIYPEFWLDKAHFEHDKNKWGQNPFSYPLSIQSIFLSLFEDFDFNKPMEWSHYKLLRSYILDMLKKHNNVIFITGQTDIIQSKYGYIIRNLKSDLDIVINQNVNFYYWAQEPKKNQLRLIKPQSIVQLYQLSATAEFQKICVLGSGLSVLWVLEHFPNFEIISLHLPADYILEIPANSYINKSRLTRKSLDTVTLESFTENSILVKTKSENELDIVCDFYDAIGFKPVTAPSFINPESIIWDRSKDFSCTWIAPKNIPVGSTTHSYSILAYKNQRFYNDFSYLAGFYCENYYNNDFNNLMLDNGIQLNSDFFNNLKVEISNLPDPISFDKTVKLYLEIYNQTHASSQEYNQFKSIIFTHIESLQQAPPFYQNHLTKPSFLKYFNSKLEHNFKSFNDIQYYLRNAYETLLAYSYSYNDAALNQVKLVSSKIITAINNNRGNLIRMIQDSYEIQKTIYGYTKFAAMYDEKEECIEPHFLINQILFELKFSNSLHHHIHLHFLFVFRLYPLFNIDDFTHNRFFDSYDIFDKNTTLRNPIMRLPNPEKPNELDSKVFFGLVETKLPRVRKHLTSIGRWLCGDVQYLNSLEQDRLTFVTGPSGHVAKLLAYIDSNRLLDKQNKKIYMIGVMSYLIAGGNHNFHEIYLVASSYGIEYRKGHYHDSLPIGSTEGNFKAMHHFADIIGDIILLYPEFKSQIEKFHDQYFTPEKSLNSYNENSIDEQRFVASQSGKTLLLDQSAEIYPTLEDNQFISYGSWTSSISPMIFSLASIRDTLNEEHILTSGSSIHYKCSLNSNIRLAICLWQVCKNIFTTFINHSSVSENNNTALSISNKEEYYEDLNKLKILFEANSNYHANKYYKWRLEDLREDLDKAKTKNELKNWLKDYHFLYRKVKEARENQLDFFGTPSYVFRPKSFRSQFQRTQNDLNGNF